MRVLIQRVKCASVTSGGTVLGRIGQGLLVFVGIAPSDDESRVRWMGEKIARLRVFEDGAGKMNLSVADAGGGILVVSQFTLYGDASKGNRPSFTGAAAPPVAEPLYDELVRYLRATSGVPVESGAFGAAMEVRLVNDGPVTILIEK